MFVKATVWTALLAALALVPAVSGHPHEKHDRRAIEHEVNVRSAIAEVNKRALEACGNTKEIEARKHAAMERRLATFHRLRKERDLEHESYVHRRTYAQFYQYSQHSHDVTKTSKVNPSSPHLELFGSNTTCVMTPDNADGPYFVQGETIRSKVVENLVGVPVHLEMQFVDVNTCKPATQLLIDIWSCNGTGQYSGVSAAGEGGLKTTFLRGVQPTDSDGVVEFDTLFPGHYQGRANHQHVIAHVGSKVLPNNTYSGGHIAHLSQLFFDQDLVQKVEAMAPYNKNTIVHTLNLYDGFVGYSASAAYDPFPEYIMLGNDLSAGLFMWIEIGLNTSANWDAYAPMAARLGPNGGEDNPNFASQMYVVGSPPPTHG